VVAPRLEVLFVDTTGAPITNAQLLDLFGHVQVITGTLKIENNTDLTSIEGLRSVKTVGGYYLYIYSKTKLASSRRDDRGRECAHQEQRQFGHP
jgi:hypothetical protein